MFISNVVDLEPRSQNVSLEETEAGTIVSVVLSLISMSALSVCLTRRVQNVRDWSRLPLVCWLVIVIYIDSIAFVSGTAILSNAFGVASSAKTCSQAVLLCLGCYMTTKVFIYYFLVERVYIIRRSPKPRMKDPLYLFNAFGMLIPYLVVIALNFYFRFAVFENNTCRIGMKREAMIPLIAFEILVNVYLTSLFLIPLRGLYSYKNNRVSPARSIALRTFIGSCATLTSSVVNLTTVVILNGEPGWICLMCCNCDILFSVLVLHWITSKDNASTIPNPSHSQRPPSPSSKRALPDAEDEYGLSRYKSKPGVTTKVTASRNEAGEDEGDSDMIRVSKPVNAITVDCCHVREVADAGDIPSDWSVRKIGSEDEFFRKY